MPRYSKPIVAQSAAQPARRGAAPAQPQPSVQTNKKGEQITTLSNGDIEEVELNSIRARDGGETEPAVDFDDLDRQREVGPAVKRFIVIRGGRVQTHANGQRATVSVGKQLDDLNFDIPLMRRQGIEVRELDGSELDSVG